MCCPLINPECWAREQVHSHEQGSQAHLPLPSTLDPCHTLLVSRHGNLTSLFQDSLYLPC